jgi:RNA polymerase-binding protein DksA
MRQNWPEGLRERLDKKRLELNARLARISANVRRSLDSDSEERAKQLDDSEVVDALGNETRAELKKITIALKRMDEGDYGTCEECGLPIAAARIEAYPYATACIDCAELDEEIRARR